jgi:hypothetical protein
VHLADDEIIRYGDGVLVTKWQSLKPRVDFTNGISCYFFDLGIKVSKMMTCSGELLYHYCDIFKAEFYGDAIFFHDLLADVIIYPNGTVKVLDVGEIADALTDGLITKDDVVVALKALDRLLTIINEDKFYELLKYL